MTKCDACLSWPMTGWELCHRVLGMLLLRLLMMMLVFCRHVSDVEVKL